MTRAILILAVLLGTATSALAQSWTQMLGRPVDEIRIEGVSDDLAGPLRKGLALTPRTAWLRKKRQPMTQNLVEADLKRIRLFLARRGYPRAVIEVQARQASERKFVRLVFRVNLKERVRIGEVRVEGVDSSLRETADLAVASVRPGASFRDAEIQAARTRLRDAMAERGYARAQVTVKVSEPSVDRALVVFEVSPGARYRFGDLVIRGIPDDLVGLAREEVNLPQGDVFRPAVLTNARDDLRALNLFRQINVSATPQDSTRLKVTAALAPRDMRSLEFSVGTWSDDPVRVHAGWRHRNLLKRGRGFLASGDFTLRRRELGVALQWPSLIARRSLTELRTQYEEQEEDAYRVRVGLVRLSHRFRLSRSTTLNLGTAMLLTDVNEQTQSGEFFEVEYGRQLVFSGQWFWDAVDDPVNPTRGWRVSVDTGVAPDLPFTNASFISERAAVSRVHPLGPVRAAFRFDLAHAFPIDSSNELLPNERWFAGGYNTMRGAARYGLGPTADGDPVGGGFRVLAGTELRIPVKGIFGVTVFVDSGQVWETPSRARMSSMAVAVGTGVMFRTPVGPIRLELARNVAEAPIDGNRYQIQFGIGHPY